MKVSTLSRSNRIKPALLVVAVAGLAAITFAARGQQTGGSSGAPGTATSTAASDQTTAFIQQAARGNDKEVALAEVGVRKAQNPELKTFSQQLQKDHTQANNKLRPIARKYGVPIDQPLPKADLDELAALESASGAQFDQQYATQLLKDHQQEIATYENAIQQVQAPDVKQYAQNTLPVLRQHMQRAETAARDVGVDQATISAITAAPPAAVGGTTEPFSETTKGAGAAKLKGTNLPPQP